MPDSEKDEPSKADHEQRIAQLEATVEKLMPSRRSVLAGMAGAGIGAAGMYGASETARAQAAGQVGTETDPVDVKAWNLNVANQLTSDLDAGGNSVTNLAGVETEELRTTPTRTIVQLDGNQTIADDALTIVAWESESDSLNVSNTLDGIGNAVVVPEGYSFAKCNFSLVLESQPANHVSIVDVSLNDSSPITLAGFRTSAAEITESSLQIETVPFAVSEGDEIKTRLLIDNGGSSINLIDGGDTGMEVSFL